MAVNFTSTCFQIFTFQISVNFTFLWLFVHKTDLPLFNAIQWPVCMSLHAACKSSACTLDYYRSLNHLCKHIITNGAKKCPQTIWKIITSPQQIHINYKSWNIQICQDLLNSRSAMLSRKAFICAHSSLVGAGTHSGWSNEASGGTKFTSRSRWSKSLSYYPPILMKLCKAQQATIICVCVWRG
jgi:hypothetical protein